jgi:hypothetical protein
MPRSFEDIIKSYSADVQELAHRARRLVLQLLPGVEETIDPTTAVASYGYGSGSRGMVCTLILSKSGVKLGLVRGAELSDPHRLLDGKGKTHKSISLRTAGDLDRPGVEDLIRAAHAAWRERNDS